jgi:hypothetical protein
MALEKMKMTTATMMIGGVDNSQAVPDQVVLRLLNGH